MAAVFFQNGVSIGGSAGWCGYTGSNNYVVRYQFTTGPDGADTVSLSLSNIYYGSGAGSQGFGFKLSSSSVAYANARNTAPDSDYAVMSYREGSGYGCTLTAAGLNLQPASTYYIFVFVATAGTEYYSGWNCLAPQISLSGSYTPPAGAISSITAQVSTGSPVSVIMSSPYPYHIAAFSHKGKELGKSDVFGSSLSHICPREYMEADKNAQSLEIDVSIQGYRDALCTTAAGEPVKTGFVLNADSLMRPIVPAGAISVKAVNEGVDGEFDQFISGVSRAEISFDSSAIGLENCAGAEITGYALSYCGKRERSDSSTVRTERLSGDCTVNCIVIDSRGREGSYSLELSLLPYVPPSLTDMKATRCDAEGLLAPLGEFYRLRAAAAFTEIEGNSCRVYARLQPTGGDWGERLELSGFESGIWSHQWASPAILGGGLQGDSYKLELSITDRLGWAARYTVDMYHQRWALKFNAEGTALGLGMEPNAENALQMPESWRLYAGGIVLSEKSYGYEEPEDAVEDPAEGQLYFLLTD